MKRRDFLCWVPLLLPALPAYAQKRPRISILHSGYPNRTPIQFLFEDLRALGYEDGKSAIIELLGGEGDQVRLSALVARLVVQAPDVIIALTSPAVLALKSAGTRAPVVFAFVPDPVALGLVASLAHPGGTYTGVTYSDASLGGKRLELLADTLPRAKRIAVIWNPSFMENAALLDVIQKAASRRRIDIYDRRMRNADDLTSAFEDCVHTGAQALIFMTDNVMFGQRKRVAELALAHRIPSIHSFDPEARDGALMSFGPDIRESYRRAAALADQILKGKRPADLPVEEPTRFKFVVNLRTARALSLTIPNSVLLRADELIE